MVHKGPAWTLSRKSPRTCGDLCIINPALVDRYGNIIANERILAASRLGVTRFLVIVLDQQSEGHPPAPRITGRKIVDNTPWDNGAGHGRLTETKKNTKDKDK